MSEVQSNPQQQSAVQKQAAQGTAKTSNNGQSNPPSKQPSTTQAPFPKSNSNASHQPVSIPWKPHVKYPHKPHDPNHPEDEDNPSAEEQGGAKKQEEKTPTSEQTHPVSTQNEQTPPGDKPPASGGSSAKAPNGKEPSQPQAPAKTPDGKAPTPGPTPAKTPDGKEPTPTPTPAKSPDGKEPTSPSAPAKKPDAKEPTPAKEPTEDNKPPGKDVNQPGTGQNQTPTPQAEDNNAAKEPTPAPKPMDKTSFPTPFPSAEPKNLEEAQALMKTAQADLKYAQEHPEFTQAGMERLRASFKLLQKSGHLGDPQINSQFRDAGQGYLDLSRTGKPSTKQAPDPTAPKLTKLTDEKYHQESAENAQKQLVQNKEKAKAIKADEPYVAPQLIKAQEKNLLESEKHAQKNLAYHNQGLKDLNTLGIKDLDELDKKDPAFAKAAGQYYSNSRKSLETASELKEMQDKQAQIEKERQQMLPKPEQKAEILAKTTPEEQAELRKQYNKLNKESAELKEKQEQLQAKVDQLNDKKRVALAQVEKEKISQVQKELNALRSKKPDAKSGDTETEKAQEAKIKELEGKVKSSAQEIEKNIVNPLLEEQKQIDKKRSEVDSKNAELNKRLETLTHPGTTVQGPDGKPLSLRSEGGIHTAIATIQSKLGNEQNPQAKEIFQQQVQGLQSQLREIEQTRLDKERNDLQREKLQLDYNEKQMAIVAAKEQMPGYKAEEKTPTGKPVTKSQVYDLLATTKMPDRFKEQLANSLEGKPASELAKMFPKSFELPADIKQTLNQHNLNEKDAGNVTLVRNHLDTQKSYDQHKASLEKRQAELDKKYGNLPPAKDLSLLPKTMGLPGSGGATEPKPGAGGAADIKLIMSADQQKLLAENAKGIKEFEDSQYSLVPKDNPLAGPKPPAKEDVEAKTVNGGKEAKAKEPDKPADKLESPVLDATNVPIEKLDPKRVEEAKESLIEAGKKAEEKGIAPITGVAKSVGENDMNLRQEDLDALAVTMDRLGFNFMGLPISMYNLNPNLSLPGKAKGAGDAKDGGGAPGMAKGEADAKSGEPHAVSKSGNSYDANRLAKNLAIGANTHLLAPVLENPLNAAAVAGAAMAAPEVAFILGAAALVEGAGNLAKGGSELHEGLSKEDQKSTDHGIRDAFGGTAQVLMALEAFRAGAKNKSGPPNEPNAKVSGAKGVEPIAVSKGATPTPEGPGTSPLSKASSKTSVTDPVNPTGSAKTNPTTPGPGEKTLVAKGGGGGNAKVPTAKGGGTEPPEGGKGLAKEKPPAKELNPQENGPTGAKKTTDTPPAKGNNPPAAKKNTETPPAKNPTETPPAKDSTGGNQHQHELDEFAKRLQKEHTGANQLYDEAMSELTPRRQQAQATVAEANTRVSSAEAEATAAERELSGARTVATQLAARARHQAAQQALAEARAQRRTANANLSEIEQQIASAERFRSEFPGTVQNPRQATPVNNQTNQPWNNGEANVQGHWRDHGHEFPEFSNWQEYAEAARRFGENPPAGTQSMTSANGDTIMYDPASNTMAIYTPQGAPRTFYHPAPNNPTATPGQPGYRGHRAPSNYQHFLEIGNGLGRRPS